MTARLFGFDVLLPVSSVAFDRAVRLLARVGGLARPTVGTGRQVVADRRLPYCDTRMLRDIGLRPDDFPCVARERLHEWIMRHHIQ
jgi:hypothetical protein